VDETERQAAFVGLVGRHARAERLQRIWNNSYPSGTAYDRIFSPGRYRTKEQVFRLKARREGFKDNEISSFLEL